VVCNDSRVLELLKHYVPTADDCGRYETIPQIGYHPRKQALEYHLLEGALKRIGLTIDNSQGTYIITPSGKVIAGCNRSLNVESTLSEMRKGLDVYAKMSREERLLSRAPDPKKDRMVPERERPRPPVDGLILRVVGRGFEDNIDELCQLRPRYYSLDRLWYTREEAMQFLPDTLRAGQKKEITGPVLNGLAQLHLIARGSYFHDNEVKELRLASEVVETRGPTVKLKLSGRAVLEADDQVRANKYRPDLLGYITYDTEKKSFTRFELLAYGMHNLGAKDMKKGGPEYIPMAFLFTLNGSNANDNQSPTKLDLYRRFVKLKAGN
jgi:hypothetical protein